GRKTDPTLELSPGQRAAFDAAVERVVVVDTSGKFLTEQPLVDVLFGNAAQVINEGGPDDSIGPALYVVVSDLFPVLHARYTPVEGHLRRSPAHGFRSSRVRCRTPSCCLRPPALPWCARHTRRRTEWFRHRRS